MKPLIKFFKAFFGKIQTKKDGKPYCPRYKCQCFPIDLNGLGKCVNETQCKSRVRLQKVALELGVITSIERIDLDE